MWSNPWLQLSLLTYRQWWWMKRTQTVQKPPPKRHHLNPTLPTISEMLSSRHLPPPFNRTATSPNRPSKRLKRRRPSLPKRPTWEVCSSSRCRWKSRRGRGRKKTSRKTVEVQIEDLSSKSHSQRNSITQSSVVRMTTTIKNNRLKRRTRMLRLATQTSLKLTALNSVRSLTLQKTTSSFLLAMMTPKICLVQPNSVQIILLTRKMKTLIRMRKMRRIKMTILMTMKSLKSISIT